MVPKNLPLEGDCEICGEPLDKGEMSRNFHRDYGTMTCDNCSHLYTNKYKTYEE